MNTTTKFNVKGEMLDWNGNPIPGVYRRKSKDNGFRIYEDGHGKKYWINEGERDYVLPFLTVSECNENGLFEIVYDSRCSRPLPEKV